MNNFQNLPKRILFNIEFQLRLHFSKSERAPQSAVKITLLTAVRNEMAHLPSFFKNTLIHIDGFIALDDGSSDDSYEFIKQQAKLLKAIRKTTTEPHVWNEPYNKQLLIDTAISNHAEWVLVLDADERLEHDFRLRADIAIALAEKYGFSAIGFRLREVWDQGNQMRVDGIWGRKTRARLFKLASGHRIPSDELHGDWLSTEHHTKRHIVVTDIFLYHLGMLTKTQREQRSNKYKKLDPHRQWQTIGYEYLADDTNLKLRSIKPKRMFKP